MTTSSLPGRFRAVLPALIVLALAACAGPRGAGSASAPAADTAAPAGGQASPGARRGGYYLDDGPGTNPPADLALIPDAVPRAEPLLPRTLRPYSVFGRQYVPMTRLEPFRQRGMASWYGRRYHGQPTSSGERYDMYAMTAAHPTLPIPSYVRVTHVGNGRSVVVRVNDRGPFLHDRVIDLSYTAAARLGYVETGSAEVEVELITQFDGATDAVASAAAPVATVVSAAPVPAPAAAAAPVDSAASAAPSSVRDASASPAVGVAPVASAAAVGSVAPVPSPARVGAAAPEGALPAPQPAPPAAAAKREPVRLEVETVVGASEPPRVVMPRPDPRLATLPAAAPATVAAGPSQGFAQVPSQGSPQVPSRLWSQSPSQSPSQASSQASSAVSSPAAARGFWLQLGAFGSIENARNAMAQLARRLDWLGTAFDIRQEGGLYKVQAGPWSRRDHAQAAAERIRAATDLRPFATLR